MMRVWVTLCLLMCLAGCATTQIKTVQAVPPAALLQDCPVPEVDVKNWGDLPPAVVEMRNALVSCNRDKKKLRQWAKIK